MYRQRCWDREDCDGYESPPFRIPWKYYQPPEVLAQHSWCCRYLVLNGKRVHKKCVVSVSRFVRERPWRYYEVRRYYQPPDVLVQHSCCCCCVFFFKGLPEAHNIHKHTRIINFLFNQRTSSLGEYRIRRSQFTSVVTEFEQERDFFSPA